MVLDVHEERSPEARRRAEQALVNLLYQLGERRGDLIVLGGLVPPTLAEGAPGGAPMHVGTADVDLLLLTHVPADVDLGSVERALLKMSFGPLDDEGWRWRGRVDDIGVRIEFLCDLPEYPEGEVVRPEGCSRLAAANLRGTGFVTADAYPRELTGALPDGTQVTVEARFAGLQGFLLSKCVVARTRGAAKDYYDFAYVLIHNRVGGPRKAAELIVDGPLKDILPGLRATFIEVRARYGRTGDIGARGYASEMLRVDATASESTLRADAVVAVQEFFDVLGVH